MTEIILNLHIHTNYSDGSLPHKEVAKAAMRCGLDAILITDHNIRPEGLDGYYHEGDQKVLVMIGEEIHNQDRQPQKNHLLVFGAGRDLASYGNDPQRLIDQVNQAGGICFLAHPYDPALPAFGEDNISWENWNIKGYQGIELWNGFSELKVRAHNKWHTIFLVFFPKLIAHQPPQETLKIWNELLATGQRVTAVGGSDSHAGHYHYGFLHKTIFPYEFHFSAINTHVILESPLKGDAEKDSRAILEALERGCCFVANDMVARSHGFQFYGKVDNQSIPMGSETKLKTDTDLSIHLPQKCECRLLKDGQVIQVWKNKTEIEYRVNSQGVYRIECYRNYLGKKRGWIFSNPIYIR
jgi:hypothetical protein